jgi:hypothetical protein
MSCAAVPMMVSSPGVIVAAMVTSLIKAFGAVRGLDRHGSERHYRVTE